MAEQLTARTRLVAVTAASNLIGTMPDMRAIAALTHDVGALLYVDGVHYTAHHAVDVIDMGADFYACSPYKFLGPHCGVVAGRPELLAELVLARLSAGSGVCVVARAWSRRGSAVFRLQLRRSVVLLGSEMFFYLSVARCRHGTRATRDRGS